MSTAECASIKWEFGGYPVYDPVPLQEALDQHGYESPHLALTNSFHDNRGYYPSVGRLLMLRQDVEAIGQSSSVLTLDAGDQTKRWRHLKIVKSQAVWPNASGHVTTDTTPYVVTIADAREDVERTHLNEQFNHVRSDNRTAADEMNARQVLDEIWNTSLKPVFGRSLLNHAPSDPVKHLAFHGVNAWDAFWHLLNVLGCSFRVVNGYPEVFPVKGESDSLEGAALDGEYWLERPELPANVIACCQKRDYQWYLDSANAETAGDYHRQKPVYEQRISTAPWVSGTEGVETPSGTIVPIREGDQTLWLPLVMYVEPEGTNKSYVDSVMRRYAKRWFDAQVMLNRATSYVFAGLVDKTPNSQWGCISYYDHGGGLKTRVSSVEVDALKNPRMPVSSFRPGPPNALDWAPYSREAWVKCAGPVFPSGEDETAVPPNQEAHVLLRAGTPSVGGVTWTDAKATKAMNTTGNTIKTGQEGFARWNYQLHEWCIVSMGTSSQPSGPNPNVDLPDWEAGCVNGNPVGSYNDPATIVVNRGAHLRLLALSRQKMGVEISKGPARTVFNTGDDGTIYWSDSPRMKNVWLVGGRILFGDRGNGPASSIATGGAHVVMAEDPGRSHKYLIAETRGPNTYKLGWHGPGVELSIKVPKCKTPAEESEDFRKKLCEELLPYLCDYVSSCELYGTPYPEGTPDPCAEFACGEGTDENGDPLPPCPDPNIAPVTECDTWIFRNGLLTRHPQGTLPSTRTKGSPRFSRAVNYNPCVQDPGEGGGSDDDGQPIDPPENPNPDDGEPIDPPDGPDPPNPNPDPWPDPDEEFPGAGDELDCNGDFSDPFCDLW